MPALVPGEALEERSGWEDSDKVLFAFFQPLLPGALQAEPGTEPAACSSRWSQGHGGERTGLHSHQSCLGRSHASQGTMPQLSLPDSLPRTPTPCSAHLIQSSQQLHEVDLFPSYGQDNRS